MIIGIVAIDYKTRSECQDKLAEEDFDPLMFNEPIDRILDWCFRMSYVELELYREGRAPADVFNRLQTIETAIRETFDRLKPGWEIDAWKAQAHFYKGQSAVHAVTIDVNTPGRAQAVHDLGGILIAVHGYQVDRENTISAWVGEEKIDGMVSCENGPGPALVDYCRKEGFIW